MKQKTGIIVYILLSLLIMSSYVFAEQWKISFNGYPGTMELNGSPGNYAGRFNLHGSWEQMLDLRVYRNAIFFRRAAADQKYLGIIEGNRMQGIFSQGGAGSYPWTAEQIDSAGNDPFPTDSGFQPARPTYNRSVHNLALRKAVRQSSTGYGGTAERAVDGNKDGNYNANSVTHTNNAPQEWWEVDLKGHKQIREIKIWNRTDCCGERLANFYVLVSTYPFSGNSLQAALNDPSVWHFHHPGATGRETTIPVSGIGRYVRIQLAGQNWLSLAEVEVIGTETSTAGADIPWP